jgi:hypothetical protein
MTTTENRNRHLVENVASGTLTARLNANADLGWKVIHIVPTGSTYTVVWQRVEAVVVS